MTSIGVRALVPLTENRTTWEAGGTNGIRTRTLCMLCGTVPSTASHWVWLPHVRRHKVSGNVSLDLALPGVITCFRFNEYARRSDLKDITPDAVDISDLTAVAESLPRPRPSAASSKWSEGASA